MRLPVPVTWLLAVGSGGEAPAAPPAHGGASRRTGRTRAAAVLAASGSTIVACTLDTTALEPVGGGYASRAEVAALAAKVAFLDECHEGDVLVRDGSGWRCAAEPQCPPGYRAVVDTEVAGCTRTVEGRDDVMVKVGDFWIDRYEMSACAAGGLGGEPANDTTAKACSSRGVMPLSSITWFQAAAMCANAGKHLCSNAEWQAAVSGTTDPGPWPFVDCATGGPQVGRCNTCSTDVRLTGQASAECRSRFGAEDMIGNEWEQVGDWFAAPGTDELSAVGAEPLGPGYSNDITSNVSGTAWEGESRQYGKRVPARGLRGGGRNDGTGAGAFALNLGGSPSDYGAAVGARCCRGGR